MSVIVSLFLGLVQGIAEFLPISSSGHIAILNNLLSMDYSEENHLLFDVLLHLGTLISICFVYRLEIRKMFADAIEYLNMRNDPELDEPVVLKPPARVLLFVIIGTLPMIIAAIFWGMVSRLYLKTGFIGFALIVTGGLLFVSDKYIQRGRKTERTMTAKDAIIIGLAQAVSILPGLSRSGTTIAVGLACGMSGKFAVRFSMLLSIPAVLGGLVVSLYRAIRGSADFSQFPVYLAGFAIATIVGFFAIQLLRRLTAKEKGGLGKFAYYCWGVGALAIILSLIIQGS